MCGSNNIAKEQGEYICRSCGCKYSVEDAKKLLVELDGPIEVKGVSSVENDLRRGEQCLEAKDWDAAFKVFSIAVDKQSNNFEAWYGLLAALTHQFTKSELHEIQIDGAKGLASVLKNCNQYIPAEKKTEYLRIKHNLKDMWNKVLSDYSKQVENISPKSRFLGFIILIISIILFASLFFITYGIGDIIGGVVTASIIILIPCIYRKNKYSNSLKIASYVKIETKKALDALMAIW
jgi:hypothetical protein